MCRLKVNLEDAEDRGRAVALVREMAARIDSEEEGARVAREEIDAMRAAWRAEAEVEESD